MKFFEATNYPKIFSKTYWGSFDDKYDKIDEICIERRNEFVKKFKIKACISQKFAYSTSRSLFDHVEIYKTTEKKIVMVCSPYDHDTKGVDITVSELGFIEFPTIYYIGMSRSFYKEFDSPMQLIRFFGGRYSYDIIRL